MALDREQIIGAAVALLDERGFDGVTMRHLASRLGVSAPTLYWHLRDKAELVAGVADVILEDLLRGLGPTVAGDDWRPWLAEAAGRLRRAMLAHQDGARVVAAAHFSMAMADLTELAIRNLVECGLPLDRARLRVLSVEAFTLGHVLEEQAPRPDAAALATFDAAAFAAAHPTAVAAIEAYFAPGRTVDDLFTDELELVLR